jgi:NAD(P)-dependent dehydrogenase (short-subunit alcohol dehydrogenase family)
LNTIKDKGVLITGAGRGVGKRLAIGFATAGGRVGLLARSRAGIDLARLEIEHAGGTALSICADVRDFEQVRSAVEQLRSSFGRIDVLVAAAGIQGPIGPAFKTDPTEWRELVEVNLIGVMHACRAVLPEMIGRRSGKIIVLSGGGTTHPRANFSGYAASKAALARFVETVAEEVRDYNVQLNCMSPGGTYTHMTDEILQAGDSAGSKEGEDARRIRLTGGVPPDKQIELALFLVSEKSNHVSGKIIHVNDDWKRLEHSNIHPELFTLRRVQKV